MDTELMINPEKLASIQKFCDINGEAVMAIQIKDAMTLAEATELGMKLKGAINKLEAMRKEAVEPLNNKVKEINNKIKFFTEPLKAAKEMLNEKMVNFQREEMRQQEKIAQEAESKRQQEIARVEAARAEALEKAQAAARKLEDEKLTQKQKEAAQKKIDKAEAELVELSEKEEDISMETAMVEPPKKTVRTASGAKATYRERWTYKIEDELAIPGEYMCVDEKKISAAVRNGVREIPGVKIYKDLSLSQ